MVVFAGIDLAWTRHHESGVCVIEGSGADARLRMLTSECQTPEYFSELCSDAGEDVVVAIDAPLIVEPGRRAERELARVFGAASASAYTASMEFLTKMNGLAGPTLASLLIARGFSIVPSALGSRSAGRVAVEVFPHPAHVELFSLRERLPYKKGRMAGRREAMAAYQGHLSALLRRELPGVLGDPSVAEILAPEAVELPGRRFKALEDQLDALTCAYVAHHCWTYGQKGFRVFGDDATGAIVVPLRITSSPELSSP